MADTTGAGAGTERDGAIDEVAYKLEDWDDESFVEAEEALRAAGVSFRREGLDTLVVGPDDEEAVDRLLDAVESRRAAAAGVDLGEPGDIGEAADGGHEELIYELVEWSPEMRNQLSLVLERDGIVHEWEGDDLVVAAAVETQVDDLIDQIEQGDELAPAVDDVDDVDDEAEYNLLSDLFIAADRLANNPSDLALCGDLVDAAAPTGSMPVPFGVDEATWQMIRQQVTTLVGAIETEEPDTTVGERAGVLAELLRTLV